MPKLTFWMPMFLLKKWINSKLLYKEYWLLPFLWISRDNNKQTFRLFVVDKYSFENAYIPQVWRYGVLIYLYLAYQYQIEIQRHRQVDLNVPAIFSKWCDGYVFLMYTYIRHKTTVALHIYIHKRNRSKFVDDTKIYSRAEWP